MAAPLCKFHAATLDDRKGLKIRLLQVTDVTSIADYFLFFLKEFLNLVNEDSYKYECPDVMLFTIVELTGSTAYNSILYNEPLSIEEYKPYLYRTVRLIIASHRQ